MLGVFCCLGCKESGEDTAGLVGFTGVSAQGVLGQEVLVAFDGESHGATECLDLREADIAEFGEAESQVTESECDVGVGGVDLRQEPGGTRVRGEELHDGHEVDALPAIAGLALRDAVLRGWSAWASPR